jgi:cytochrome c553
MRRVQLVLFAALAALAALVLVFALRNRQPPFLPTDSDHDPSRGTAVCLVCHGPEGPSPRGANHPNGIDCLRCHGTR